jgi:lipopolysaccharide/colanic/teichoic acid biosynthesis glycosyltransferase
MIRLFDVLFAATGLMLGAPLFALLLIVVWWDTRSPLFRQVRLGRGRREFTLVKFRTMRLDTADVPTHMVSAAAVTPLGAFLRRSKLDELPQLWNVLRGDMSLVGPRPGLPAQHELVRARESEGVFAARPGITGLAQLRGIDMSTPELLARTDAEMLRGLNVRRYFAYIVRTALGGGAGDRVRHP